MIDYSKIPSIPANGWQCGIELYRLACDAVSTGARMSAKAHRDEAKTLLAEGKRLRATNIVLAYWLGALCSAHKAMARGEISYTARETV